MPQRKKPAKRQWDGTSSDLDRHHFPFDPRQLALPFSLEDAVDASVKKQSTSVDGDRDSPNIFNSGMEAM